MSNVSNSENAAVKDSEKIADIRRIKKKFKGSRDIMGIFEENKSYFVLFGVILTALAVILISILGLKIAVVPVCAIILLEAGIAACLHDVPIWLHVLVMVAQILAGVLCNGTVFMILCAAVYLVGILSLNFFRNEI